MIPLNYLYPLAFLLLSLIHPTTSTSAPTPPPGFHTIFSETFTSSTINLSIWNHYAGIGQNGEQETYPDTPTNCHLTGSTLQLLPFRTATGWTSCRIETKPIFSAPVGGKLLVQASLKLGQVGLNHQGIWPAFWSIGSSIRTGTPWPACGEIDTFENINGGSMGYGTVHCGSQCNDPDGLSAGIQFSYGDYHTWAHEIDRTIGDWKQQAITFTMDGQVYHVVRGSDVGTQAQWVALAQDPMFVILNVAVGGQWPGPSTTETSQGVQAGMEVKYVAVYST